jgi:predicted RNA-binding protein
MVENVRIDMSSAWSWKLSEMMDHFRMPETERQALFARYGLKPDDVVMVNYDIYLDLAPFPKK